MGVWKKLQLSEISSTPLHKMSMYWYLYFFYFTLSLLDTVCFETY